MIENDDQNLSQIDSRRLQESIRSYCLIPAKVLRTCYFIKNPLYHGCSPCSFPNFPEFLETFGADVEYRAFRLCAIIDCNIYLHFYFFKDTQTHCYKV